MKLRSTDSDGICYKLKKKKKGFVLKSANTNQWTEEFRGKKLASLVNTGDEIILSFRDNRTLLLQHHEVEEALWLLKAQLKSYDQSS